jgi:alpha,alpha-trehalase
MQLATSLSPSALNTDLKRTPSQLYGELFVDVQMQQIFKDGKTFVDATPKELDAETLMGLYQKERHAPDFSLSNFVHEHFCIPTETIDAQVKRSDQGLRQHISALWPTLVRTTTKVEQDDSTLLPLPSPYVVPGGRFREIYYWDSYFTMTGLLADGRRDLAVAMLNNFANLIERFGYVPTGNRSYYLSRSQPPYFFKMVELVTGGGAAAIPYLPHLRAEYQFWMRGEEDLQPGEATAHLVRLKDGSLVNRYWDELDTPREESFMEDVHTARSSNRPANEVYRDLRAGAESGWDFSGRWCVDGHDLSSIETTSIAPIDLNCLVWGLERTIANISKHYGDHEGAANFDERARLRRNTIEQYFWSESGGCYVDYHWVRGEQHSALTAATTMPLFLGLADPKRACITAETVERQLLAKNGLQTTLQSTGQQWDSPNGWAPLQYIAVIGLRRYGQDELAREIACRWLKIVQRVYLETGTLLEKYNVLVDKAGGGGEYPTQDGFGWTNGTYVVLSELYLSSAEREK